MDMKAKQAAEREAGVASAVSTVGSIYLADRQQKQFAASEKRHEDYMQTLRKLYPSTTTPAGEAQAPAGVGQTPVSKPIGANHPLSGKSSVRNRTGKPSLTMGWEASRRQRTGGR